MGAKKCTHKISGVDGPEDLAKFGDILLVSSNNYV